MAAVEGSERVKRYAYFYTDWVSPISQTSFMKSMLLFFDGILISLPPHLAAPAMGRNDAFMQSLREYDLVKNVDPHTIDLVHRRQLGAAIEEVVNRIGPGHLSSESPFRVTSASLTSAHFGVQDRVLRTLLSAGFVRPSGNDLVKLSPLLRSIVLYLYCQALVISHRNDASGIRVEPVGDSTVAAGIARRQLQNFQLVQNLHLVQNAPLLKIADHMLSEIDLPNDISRFSMNELLDFKSKHGADLRAYMKAIETLKQDITASDDPARLLAERRQELQDYEATIRRKTGVNKARNAALLTFAAAGSTWTAMNGDTTGALLALLAAAAGLQPNSHRRDVTSFSYVSQIRRKFG